MSQLPCWPIWPRAPPQNLSPGRREFGLGFFSDMLTNSARFNYRIMRDNLPIILLGILLIAVICVSYYTDPRYQDKQNNAGSRAPTASVTPNDTNHPGQDAQTPKAPPFWRVLVAWPEGVTALAVLLTLFFIAWQATLMSQTVSASAEVSKIELRAYLTVVIGAGFFQERREADKGGDLMFECRPLLVNTGQTPARNITFKARAAVMPFPLPKEVNLPEAPDDDVGGSILGPQQNAHMFAVVDGFRPENEVQGIKYATSDKGLYVWGRVVYKDIFGETHFTRFCQRIYWDMQGNVRGNYIPGRNDAD